MARGSVGIARGVAWPGLGGVASGRASPRQGRGHAETPGKGRGPGSVRERGRAFLWVIDLCVLALELPFLL